MRYIMVAIPDEHKCFEDTTQILPQDWVDGNVEFDLIKQVGDGIFKCSYAVEPGGYVISEAHYMFNIGLIIASTYPYGDYTIIRDHIRKFKQLTKIIRKCK